MFQDAQATADEDGDEDDNAAANGSRKTVRHKQQQQRAQGGSDDEGEPDYLSPIHEDDDEEEGVDCECRRIDQEQLSFNVGFFNAKVRLAARRVGRGLVLRWWLGWLVLRCAAEVLRCTHEPGRCVQACCQ